jgi:Protein of unknown function (DUF1189)
VRTYGMLGALVRAPVFSKALYTDVALNWRGVGALYLLFLSFLTWLPIMIIVTVSMTNFINYDAAREFKDFPTIKLEKGQVSSDVAQPYIMKDDRGQPVFVLDTTGKVTDPRDMHARLLITKTEMVQDNGGVIQRRSLAGFPDVTVDQAFLISWMKVGRNCLMPVVWPVFSLFSFAVHLLLTLLFGAIGLGFSSAFGAGLGFAAAMRIAAVAATGPMLLDLILNLTHVPGACAWWLLLTLLTLAYAAYGVKKVADLTRQGQGFPVAPAIPPPLPDSGLQPPSESQFP